MQHGDYTVLADYNVMSGHQRYVVSHGHNNVHIRQQDFRDPTPASRDDVNCGTYLWFSVVVFTEL